MPPSARFFTRTTLYRGEDHLSGGLGLLGLHNQHTVSRQVGSDVIMVQSIRNAVPAQIGEHLKYACIMCFVWLYKE